MPHHKSAEKRLVTNERDRLRNVAIKSLLRKQLKKQRQASPTEAAGILPESYGEIDRAWRKGALPRRRADRLKSRLARALRRAQA